MTFATAESQIALRNIVIAIEEANPAAANATALSAIIAVIVTLCRTTSRLT